MNDDIRPDLPDDALRSSLRHAADDVAFAVPDLLPQARAARRGRRMRATVAGSGLVVAALLIIPPMFGPSRAVPAAPTLTPAPTASGHPAPRPTQSPDDAMALPSVEEPGAIVAHDEIIRRCQSQLQSSTARFGHIPDDLRVARDRTYREGEIVRLASDTGWNPNALCVIPTADVYYSPIDLRLERKEVPQDPADPGRDPYLMQLCSELYTHEDERTGARSYDTVDLRDGRIVSLGGLTDVTPGSPNNVFDALLSLGDERYECGWTYTASGDLRFFTDDQTFPKPSHPDPHLFDVHVSDAYWDGRSPTATLVLWGDVGPKVAGVAVDETTTATSSVAFYEDRGMYRLMATVTPTGTAERWTSPPITLYELDEAGERVGSVSVPIEAP
jgi:hypothetical protein